MREREKKEAFSSTLVEGDMELVSLLLGARFSEIPGVPARAEHFVSTRNHPPTPTPPGAVPKELQSAIQQPAKNGAVIKKKGKMRL